MTQPPQTHYSEELLNDMYNDINQRINKKPKHTQKHPIRFLLFNASIVNILLLAYFLYYEQLHTLYMERHGFGEALTVTSPYMGLAMLSFILWLVFTGSIAGSIATFYILKKWRQVEK